MNIRTGFIVLIVCSLFLPTTVAAGGSSTALASITLGTANGYVEATVTKCGYLSSGYWCRVEWTGYVDVAGVVVNGEITGPIYAAGEALAGGPFRAKAQPRYQDFYNLPTYNAAVNIPFEVCAWRVGEESCQKASVAVTFPSAPVAPTTVDSAADEVGKVADSIGPFADTVVEHVVSILERYRTV